MALTVRDIKEPDVQVLPNGQEHGLLKVYSNSVPDNEFKRFKEKDRPAMQSLHKDEGRMVKVMYMNRKDPDKKWEKPYCRWDGDPVLQYKFLHNQTYLVPYGLIKETKEYKGKKRSGLLDPKTNKELMADTDEQCEHYFVSAEAI